MKSLLTHDCWYGKVDRNMVWIIHCSGMKAMRLSWNRFGAWVREKRKIGKAVVVKWV